jgi:uncharacterized protein (TIGR02680 family)
MTPLPKAITQRFQPLRSGLLNLFKYQDQEFWFEKGRLLVRGNNGTGKSRVLALQLPFLFDGEIASRRVEPDSDPARQMAWHLLMEDQFEQRTGYTWIEFGRLDEQGAERYITLGCGMKAVKGGDNQPSRWYFITTKRIGAGLALQDASTPRSAERLHEALDANDFFTKTAKDYRAEINRRLFGLSGSAYAALIELLIRLRAPQLSKKLDEKTLFEALSNALPSLAADVVDQVANSFKQLEDLRQQYQTLKELQESLRQFRSGYQTYLQTLLIRRADDLTSRHSQYEKARSRVTNLQQTIEAGITRRAEAESKATQAQNHLTACEAEHTALQSRPEANLASELDNAERIAKVQIGQFEAAKRRIAASKTQLDGLDDGLKQQEAKAGQAHAERLEFEENAQSKAAPTGFAKEHAECVPSGNKWPTDIQSLQELQQAHHHKGEDHLYRLKQIGDEQAKLADADSKYTTVLALQNQAHERVESIRDQMNGHQEAALAALDAFASAYREWCSTLRWISMPAWSELEPTLVDWVETNVAEHRVFSAELSSAIRRETEAHAQSKALLLSCRERIEHEIKILDDESASLAIKAAAPVLPKVRSLAGESRSTRPGAALWNLCEFQTHLSAEQQTGLEAALEASGLLDAWISPEGQVSLVGMPADTFLQIEPASSTVIGGATLADALRLDENAHGVTPLVLMRVLQQIGLRRGHGLHWVSFDGAWQLGPLQGRGEKSSSEFVGTRNREAARQRRLREISAERQRFGDDLSRIDDESVTLDARRTDSQWEFASAPKDDEIAARLTLRTHTHLQLNEAILAFDDAVRQTTVAKKIAADQRIAFETLVRHLGYGEHLLHINELRGAWNNYELAMSELWNKTRAWLTAEEHLQRAESAQLQAAETHSLESEALAKIEKEAIEAKHTFDALKSSVGLSVSDYQSKLSHARQAKIDANGALSDANREVHEIEKQLIGLQHELPAAEEKVGEWEISREDSIRALKIIFDQGLFVEADERLAGTDPQSWASSRAVIIARTILKTLPDLDHDDDAWKRRLNALDIRITELRNSNGNACTVESEQLGEGLTLIICVYQGSRRRPGECLLAIERERETHDRLLAEKERKIIDQHLVNEVSLQLRELIEQARVRTNKINNEMTRCATTLGVTMKLSWEARTEGLPPALPAVLKLLLMDHGAWSDEQRQTVGNFLHQLIKDERINNPTASASEQLLTALDYRRWHAFAAARHQNGRWEPLTRRRYGTGSGGEKALMLTIPQMAAAASHYSSAAPHAPRFILLDEAFAGMDKPTRSKCMGLIEAFDLDLMMTSEREQGAHATISGIAIYQLNANAEAVAATRWVWNGSRKLLATVPDTPELRPT